MILGGWTVVPPADSLLAASIDYGRTYYIGLGIVLVILVIALISAYRTWEEVREVEEPDSPAEILASLEKAHAQGELDDREFERVRRLLGGEGEPASRPGLGCHARRLADPPSASEPDAAGDPAEGATGPTDADRPIA